MALRIATTPTPLQNSVFSLRHLSSKQPHLSLTRIAKPYCSSMSSEALTHTITLPGQPVQIVAAPGITPSEFRSAIESSLFQQWLNNLQAQNGALCGGTMSLSKVLIQGVDYFGKRVGFLKFKADIVDKEIGKKVRIPTGRFVLELPAGMLDDNKGDFVGTAVREVEEETGIQLRKEDMIELTAFLDPSTGGKVLPSPGGCDEEISVFLCQRQVGKDIIQQLQGKKTAFKSMVSS